MGGVRSDRGMVILRHAGAGYEGALRFADDRSIRRAESLPNPPSTPAPFGPPTPSPNPALTQGKQPRNPVSPHPPGTRFPNEASHVRSVPGALEISE